MSRKWLVYFSWFESRPNTAHLLHVIHVPFKSPPSHPYFFQISFFLLVYLLRKPALCWRVSHILEFAHTPSHISSYVLPSSPCPVCCQSGARSFLGCNHLFISPPDHPLHAGRDFFFFFWQEHVTGGSLRRHGMLARLSLVMSVATDGRGLDPVLPLGVTKR